MTGIACGISIVNDLKESEQCNWTYVIGGNGF